MEATRFIRTAGLLCAVAALIEIAGGIITTALPSLSDHNSGTFVYTQVLFTVTGLMFFLGVVGFGLTGAAGSGWLAKIGLSLALLGRLIFIPAELSLLLQYDTGQVLLGICTPIIGVGMVLAGIATILAKRWQGLAAYTPLLCGLYTFLILLPAFAINGGPNFLAIGGWGMCWVLFGLTLRDPHVEPQVNRSMLKV